MKVNLKLAAEKRKRTLPRAAERPRPQKRTLTRPEAAEFLGIKPVTLSAWACRGEGPPYIRVGRSVRYRVADLEAWEASRRVDPERRHETA